MRRLIKKFSQYISKINGFSETEAEKIEYSMRIIIFETLKCIAVLVLFSILGYKMEAVIVIIVMITTKPFIGGYHEDTQLKCLGATLLIAASVIYLSINVKLNLASLIILNVLSVFCFYEKAPVIDEKMPLTKESLINRNRILGLSTTCFYSIIAVLLYKNSKASALITWILVIQALLMFNKRKK